MRAKILYEDKEILIAYKPAGLAVQTAGVGQEDLVSELKNYLKSSYLGIVHRLDQPVEGLLVFAKNRTAAAELSRQLGKGTLCKQYNAVICGKPSVPQGTLVDYLIRDGRTGMAAVADQSVNNAKRASLEFAVLREISTPEQLALMNIHIDTGRFHQIRVQMAHAGMPLLGDRKYGDEVSGQTADRLGIRTVALCACLLEVRQPVTGRRLSYRITPEGKAFHYFSID